MGAPRETSLGGEDRALPSTRWSVVVEAGKRESPDFRRAMNDLCRLYWKPIYAYVRTARGMDNETAKDATQEFLLELVEGNLLTRYSVERGSFRAYLRGALHLFLLERHRQAGSLKRGGGRAVLALDDHEMKFVDRLVVAPDTTPEEAFDRQWANSVIDHAVIEMADDLTRAGKEAHFKIFDRYELHPAPGEPLSHAQLAAEFGLKESDVNHVLAGCRRMLREKISDKIRDYVGSESEVAEEIRRFFQGGSA